MYVGMSFFRIRGWDEVGMYVGVLWMRFKGVIWNIVESMYDVRRVHVLLCGFLPMRGRCRVCEVQIICPPMLI